MKWMKSSEPLKNSKHTPTNTQHIVGSVSADACQMSRNGVAVEVELTSFRDAHSQKPQDSADEGTQLDDIPKNSPNHVSHTNTGFIFYSWFSVAPSHLSDIPYRMKINTEFKLAEEIFSGIKYSQILKLGITPIYGIIENI